MLDPRQNNIEGKQKRDVLFCLDISQKKLLESFADLVFLLDAKGSFLYINKEKHKHLLGSRNEYIGNPIYYCVLEDDQEKLKAAIKKINEGSIEEEVVLNVPIPTHFRLQNQEYMYLSCKLSPFEKEGDLTILVVVREVSQWVHKLDNHIRLQKQEKKAFELFYKNSGLIITTLDLNFNILDITGTFDEFSKKEVIGKNIQDFHSQEIWESIVKPTYKKAVKIQEPLSYEASYEKDNKTHYYLEIITPLFNKGKLSGLMLGTIKQDTLERADSLIHHIDGMVAQIHIKNDQIKVVYLSEGAALMLGKHHANILKTDFNYLYTLIHPNEVKATKERIDEAIHLKMGWNQKGRFLIENRVIYFHCRSSISEKEDGSLLITILTLDNTKEKQLEEKNSALGQELTQLIDTANAPIFGVDTKGNINEWNQKAAEITGFSKKSVFGKSLVSEFISEAYKKSVQEVLDSALKGIETSNYELPLITKAGTRVMVLLNATTRRNVSGDIVGVVGVGQDISEIDDVRDKLRNQNRLFCDLEDFSDTFSWEIDLKTNILWWSDKGYELLKVNRDQVLTPDFFMSLLSDEIKQKVKECMDRLFSTKQSQEMEISFKHLGGRIFYESKHLILDDAGEPIKICGQMQDITEKKRLKEALDKAKQAKILAEEQNKLKTEFMANMSHELRTPLNAIMGFSQLLDKQIPGKLNQKQSRYISQIYSGGKHLLSLIEDILNLDKCEGSQLELQMERIHLDDFLCDAMDNFRELASKKEIAIHLYNKVEYCQVDPIRLTQMLYNLISNAIKFSKEKTNIYITIQNTQKHTEFLVRDEGCGIEKKYQKIIFEKFKQLENPFTKMAEGTGLGLPLARSLAFAHGGDLILEKSDVEGKNQGSTFKLLIPS